MVRPPRVATVCELDKVRTVEPRHASGKPGSDTKETNNVDTTITLDQRPRHVSCHGPFKLGYQTRLAVANSKKSKRTDGTLATWLY